MATPHHIQALRVALGSCETRGGASGYIREMWSYALNAQEKGEDPEPSEFCDAIPYVPVAPEAFGCALRSDSRLLDVGSLAGYGLFDFASRRRKQGQTIPRMVGVDVDPVSVRVGREMANLWAGDMDVVFQEGRAERLPFADSAFDVVIARLLLPYVRIRPALAEISRVLKPAGITLFQIHSFRYYWMAMLARGHRPSRLLYYLKPLIGGAVFAAVGHQFRHRRLSETALSCAMLVKSCGRCGLQPVWQGGFARKPLMAFRKAPAHEG